MLLAWEIDHKQIEAAGLEYIYIYDLSKRVLNYKTKYALINEQQFSWVRLG
jgi:hypothetical protein